MAAAAAERRGSWVSLSSTENDIVEGLKGKVRALCVGLFFSSCPENIEFEERQLQRSFARFFGEFNKERLRQFHTVIKELSIDEVEIVRLNSAGVALDPAYAGVNLRGTFAATMDKVIYLGDAFFHADERTQVLTLLHELTHACASTEDGSLHARSTDEQIVAFARRRMNAALNVAYCYEAFVRENYDFFMAAAESASSVSEAGSGVESLSGVDMSFDDEVIIDAKGIRVATSFMPVDRASVGDSVDRGSPVSFASTFWVSVGEADDDLDSGSDSDMENIEVTVVDRGSPMSFASTFWVSVGGADDDLDSDSDMKNIEVTFVD